MLAAETTTDLHLTDAPLDRTVHAAASLMSPDRLHLAVERHDGVADARIGTHLTRDHALQLLDHLAAWLYATAAPAAEAVPTCCTGEDGPCCPETPDSAADGYGWPDPLGDKPASIALEAHAAVYGDRQDDYGHPREDFTRTAIIWTGLLQHKLAEGAYIEAEDIARCQIGVKLARDVHAPKRDNRVDMAGYAITLDRLETGA